MKEIRCFDDLLGETLVAVDKVTRNLDNDDELRFTLEDGRVFKLFHYQDCCESVDIEDIVGNFEDLVGAPLVQAEEVTNAQDTHPEGGTPPNEYYDDSFTWTFYKMATTKVYVTIRWFGSSNGYYSESVDFEQVL